jgi:hypothetical protein
MDHSVRRGALTVGSEKVTRCTTPTRQTCGNHITRHDNKFLSRQIELALPVVDTAFARSGATRTERP